MKIKVKNLGALKQAEFTLGELTIICGGNIRVNQRPLS
jgi:hypothetical protein